MNQLNNYIFDQFIQLNPITSSEQIIVIRIDDTAINALGWPIDRNVYTSLLERLNQPEFKPKAIGIGLMFAQSRSDDSAFAKQLGKHNSVLPIEYAVQSTPDQELQINAPITPLKEQVLLSHTDVTFDADGIVRGITLKSNGYWHFAPALKLAATGNKERFDWLAESSNYVRMRPIDPRTGYASLSLLDVLQPNYPLSILKDRYVLIGVTTSALGDSYPTLYSQKTNLNTSGIELLASSLQALLDNNLIIEISPYLNFGAIILLLLMVMVGFISLNLLTGVLFSLMLLTLYVLASFILLNQASIWMAPGTLILTILALQSIWAWRRLSEIIRAMDSRLLNYKAQHTNNQNQEIVVKYTELLDQVMDANEQELNLLGLVINELPDAVAVFNQNGLLISNKQINQIIGTSLNAEMTLNQLFELMQVDKDASLTSRTSPITIVNKQQQEGEYLINVAQHNHPRLGELTLVNLTDVTQLQSIQRQRQAAMKFLSHDMRTPLAAIITKIQAEKTNINPFNKSLLSQSEHLLSMMDDLLLILASNQFDQTLNIELIDNMLLDAIDQVAALAEKKSITIETVSFEQEPIFVNLHAKTFNRALVNLLVNAIKYSPNESTIKISSSIHKHDPARAQISIKNTIEADSLKDWMFQSHGLGQHFVSQVIKDHGGTIQLDIGETQSKIAKVTINLPLAQT
jgi:CHASE2 domain-containing sensor protein